MLGFIWEKLDRMEIEPNPKHVVRISARGDAAPLIMCHAIGGTVLFYHHLSRGLTGERPLYAIQAQGLEAGEEPIDEVQSIAARCIALIDQRKDMDIASIHFGGYSFGCFVALEMARLVEASGRTPRNVLLLAPSPIPNQISVDADKVEAEAQQLLREFLRGFDVVVPKRYRERLLSLYRAHLQAYNSYKCAPINAALEVFFPSDEGELESQWASLSLTEVRTWKVPGDHKSMIRAPHVRSLGILLEQALREPSAAKLSTPGPITSRLRSAKTR